MPIFHHDRISSARHRLCIAASCQNNGCVPALGSNTHSVAIVVDLSSGGKTVARMLRRRVTDILPENESLGPLTAWTVALPYGRTCDTRSDVGLAGSRLDALVHVVSLSFTSFFLIIEKMIG
jgi:hypothetical protein